MKQQSNTKSNLAVAALSFAIGKVCSEIQVFPAGEFRSPDGRPVDVDAWRMDAEIAKRVIAAASARVNPMVIDYEHQTLYKEKNGKPAPAAAWMKNLEWREGQGLYAIDVDWTAAASAAIEAKEYLYFSPVFSYDKTTGAVKKLILGAITNTPGIDGMAALAEAATHLLTDPDMEATNMDMEELLKQIRWMLNLPTLATAEEVIAELNKAVAAIKAGNTEAAAASFSITDLIATRNEQIAALTSAVPDPAKYVPISAMQEVQSKYVALSAQIHGSEVDGLIKTALAEGRLFPAQEAWARDLGGKDLEALNQFLAIGQPVAALTTTQTAGAHPGGGNQNQATHAELAVMTVLGLTAEEFAAGK